MKNKKGIILILISITLIVLGIIVDFGFRHGKDSEHEVKPETKDIIYTVKENETIESIGHKFNIFPEFLHRRNNISSKLEKGMNLEIPNVTLYRTKSRDTIEKVSKLFNITQKQLMIANNIESNKLKANTTIYIPNTKIHLVKDNETLDMIAKDYNLTVQQLIDENNLSKSYQLKKNDILIIPKKSGIYIDKKTNEMITLESSNSKKELRKIAVDIYKSKEYTKYNHKGNKYFVTLKQAKKKNKDIEQYLINCNDDDNIIIFDDVKSSNIQNINQHLTVKYKCM